MVEVLGILAQDLADDLSFVVSLDENILWVSEHMRGEAEYIFGETAVNWHTLPGEIKDRPRPT